MTTLAQRIQQPDVAGLPEWRVAEILNTPDAANGTKRVPIDRKRAWTVLMGRGAWPRLRLIADGRFSVAGAVPDALTLLEAAIAAVDQITRPDTTEIDATSDADWQQLQQMLGLFVMNTTLTRVDEAHMTDILALGIAHRSWPEANGFLRPLTANDIGAAIAEVQNA